MDTAVVPDCLSLWSEGQLTDGRSSYAWFCQWSCRPVPASAWQTWTACWPDTAADTQRSAPSSPAFTKTQPHSATRHLLFSMFTTTLSHQTSALLHVHNHTQPPDICSSPCSQPLSATRHLLFSFTTTLRHQKHLLFSMFTTTLRHQTLALLHVHIINKTKNSVFIFKGNICTASCHSHSSSLSLHIYTHTLYSGIAEAIKMGPLRLTWPERECRLSCYSDWASLSVLYCIKQHLWWDGYITSPSACLQPESATVHPCVVATQLPASWNSQLHKDYEA